MVKAFSLGSEKIQALIIAVHNIHSTGNGKPPVIYRCHNNGMNLFF